MTVINEKYLKAPFRPDFSGGYIFNADGFMFAQVRGWGVLGYDKNGAEIQNANLQFMVDALNEKMENSKPSAAPPSPG